MKKIFLLFQLSFSIIPLSLIVMMNFFIRIRIFPINTSRLGPLIGFTIFYYNFFEKKDERCLDILIPVASRSKFVFANIFLKKKIKDTKIFILNFFFNEKLVYFLEKFFKKKNIIFRYNIYEHEKILKKKKIIFFTNKEINQGKDLLKKMGLNNDDKIVCLHNRDEKYLQKYLPHKNWDYHNYRDFSVKSLTLAAEYLIDKGFYVIRMGKVTAETLKINNSKFIDYANTELRNDFNDIFLLSHCYLYLGSDSGIYNVPDSFKKQVAFVNFPSINLLGRYHFEKKSPSIFRLIKNNSNKYLTIKEMLKEKFETSLDINDLNSRNLKIISNNEEDILNLTKEILSDLNIENEEKNYLTKKFNEIYYNSNQNKNFKHGVPNISISFLKKYQNLLN